MPHEGTTVTISRPAPFGTSSVTVVDRGSDVAELVEMFRQAMAGAGFSEGSIESVLGGIETITDAQYGGTDD